jgi:hypothetical protein
MTTEEKRFKLQRLNNKFLNKWVIKKSKNPFKTGNQKPAFFCNKITINRDNTISFGNGTRFKTSKNAPDPFEFLIDVSKEEANHLNKLFHETFCAPLIKSENIELDSCHVRRDNGVEKLSYTLDNYKEPLYKLKLQYPQNECSAYKCPICNNIHIGKK